MSLTLHTKSGDYHAMKAIIAANFNGTPLAVNVVADDATPDANTSPLGILPALETPSGAVWQSNSVMRYIARSAPASNLAGASFQDQIDVDMWLDFGLNEIEASACALWYPLVGKAKVDENTSAIAKEAEKALKSALKVLDDHLLLRTFVVGSRITIADIGLAASLVYPFKFVLDKNFRKPFSNVVRWFTFVSGQPEFRAVAGDVALCKKRQNLPKAAKKKTAAKAPAKAKKEEAPKKKEESVSAKLKKLPKTPFVIDDWKKTYSNAKKSEEGKMAVMGEFYEKFDSKGWGVWRAEYKYNDELDKLWQVSNLAKGIIARFDELRKFMFGTLQIVTNELDVGGKGNVFMRAVFCCRDAENGGKYMQKVNPDAEHWVFTKLDVSKDADKKVINECWSKIYDINKVEGKFVYDAFEMK